MFLGLEVRGVGNRIDASAEISVCVVDVWP